MSRKDIETLRKAQLFAARFGFITQDIFFQYLCPKGRSQSYFYWKALVDDGWFIRSTRDMRVCYLSRKSRTLLGAGCLPARALTYVDHDSQLGAFYLSMNRTDLVLRAWTEADLTRAPWEAYQILGSDRLSKIPDLILDLRTDRGFLRVAVEIEKTRKSRSRYAQMAMSYLDMPRIDLMIFGCESEVIVSETRRAFLGENFQKAQKIPGTFLLNDFTERAFRAAFQFQGRDYEFAEFLRAATRLENLEFPSVPDTRPDCVRGAKDNNSEAA